MSISLANYLTTDMIELKVYAKDWKEALKASVDLLVKSGGVEDSYFDAIIESVNKLGPYFVLAPGLALGHAGSDVGVNFTCFSLITLKEPIYFGMPENDPVEIIFSFAAPTGDEHVEALQQLAVFCLEDENMKLLKESLDKQIIRDKLVSFFNHLD